MERYEAYKDSGVEWVGEVPTSWLVQRFRWTLERVNRLPLDGDEIITCFRDGEVTLRSNRREDGFTMSDKEIGYQHICAGDFVIHGMDGFAGAMGISDSDGKASPVLMVFRPIGNQDLRYINYLLRLYAWRNVFLSLSTSIRVRSCDLNWAKVAPLPMVLPSYNEQQAIADFLDAKTAEIDELVADCEREAELLQEYRKAVISEAVTKGLDPDAPMKDTGVEWIGEIPEGWQIWPLKQLINNYKAGPFGSALITSALDSQGECLVYTPEHVALQSTDTNKNLYLPASRVEEMSQFAVSAGDIVFPIVGSLGRAMVIRPEMPTGITNQRLAKFRLKSEALDCEYFMWLFGRSEFYSPYIELEKRGSIIVNLTKQIVGDMPVPLPSLREQRVIAAYLEAKTAEIDSLIEAKQSMADKLREYRKSLISEAVTGKFKVPGVR